MPRLKILVNFSFRASSKVQLKNTSILLGDYFDNFINSQIKGWTEKHLMDKRAMEVLQLVGLEKKINNKPHTLSGGEQQRIAIARALLNKPNLILADEPTGNLDPETSEEIMQLLIAVAKEEKSAVLMATHDMTIVEKFPGRVIKVEDGLLKEVNSMNRFNPFETMNL
ncbi:MAG: ATP-binding cassette domain-containing protein [Crocinitomicaceae bacterium]